MKSTKWSGYEVGDIIVSLVNKGSYRNIGDMFKIISLDSVMYYLERVNSSNPEQWRPATQQEEELFNSGFTNIDGVKIDIQPQYEIY